MENNFKKIFSSNNFSLILIIFLIVVVISLVRVILKKGTVEKYLGQLKEENLSFEKENQKLSEESKLIQSNFFIEEKARSMLGQQKPGEKVIVISSEDLSEKSLEAAKRQSNFIKWIKYFLK